MTDLSISTLFVAQDEPNTAYIFWGCVLFAIAFGLVALELVVPSGGLLGLLAGAAVVASVVSFFMYGTFAGFLSILVYLILAPIVIIFGIRLWMNSALGRRFVLSSTTDRDLDAAPDEDAGEETDDRGTRREQLRALIGAEGVTVTPLRPVGTVKFENHRIEALAETGTIGKGEPVVVTDVYDNQVKVRLKRS